MTNYLAARVHRAIGQRGGVGMLATAVVRDLDDPALAQRLVSQALVFGGDAHWFLNTGRDWVMTGSLSGSLVSGIRSSRRRGCSDRRPITSSDRMPRRSRLDPARAVALRVERASSTSTRTPERCGRARHCGPSARASSANDAGFFSRADAAGSHLALIWLKPTPDSFSRSRQLIVSKWWSFNFGRELQGDGLWTGAFVTFRNYWDLEGTVPRRPEHLHAIG